MKAVREKLNQSRGASLLLALLLFLVAAMVSVTLVSAAYTAVKRVDQNRKSQQANLTLQSAALLLQQQLENARFSVETTYTKSGGSWLAGTPAETVSPAPHALQPELKAVADRLTAGNLDGAVTGFSVETDLAQLSAVRVVCTLRDDGEGSTHSYVAVYSLTLDDREESMVLEFPVTETVTNRYFSGSTELADGTGATVNKRVETRGYAWGRPRMSSMAGGAA